MEKEKWQGGKGREGAVTDLISNKKERLIKNIKLPWLHFAPSTLLLYRGQEKTWTRTLFDVPRTHKTGSSLLGRATLSSYRVRIARAYG